MYLQPDIDKRHQATYRSERLPEELSPEYVKIDERTLEDLISQSAEFSRFLKYYDGECAENGDWRDFFRCIYSFGENGRSGHVLFSSEEELEAIIAAKPHLSLLVAFLKLFRIEQDSLNSLSESHLRYYYETVLGFSRRKGYNGTAAVSVQLNKGTASAFIPKGTEFEAGKDADGETVIYRTADDYTVTAAAIAKTVAMYPEKKEEEYAGHLQGTECGRECRVIVAVPSMEAGCTLEFSLDGLRMVSAEYTGAEGWIPADGRRDTEKSLTFSVTEEPSKYDPKVHGGETGPDCPAVRFTVPAERDFAAAGFRTYRITKTAADGGNGQQELAQSYAAVIEQLRKAVTGTLDETVSRMSGKAGEELKTDLDALSSFSRHLSASYAVPAAENKGNASERIVIKNADLWRSTPAGVTPFSGTRISFRKLQIPTSEGCRIVIGVKGAAEGTALNLFCRLDQSSCNISKAVPEDNIRWQWWTGNGWETLKSSRILRETTSSMTKTGFVTLKLPDEAFSAAGGLLPDNTLWISLLYGGSFDAYPGILSFRTDMIELEYSPDSPGKVTTGAALPAGSVKKPVLSVPGVRKFVQEYDGLKGKADEDGDSFLARVSERLRHKNRMSTMWDYERMILQEHPDLMAVKCIPATSDGKYCPGAVTVTVLPDCAAIRQDDPLMPRVGADGKESITKLIKKHASPFAEVTVANPCYRALKVKCRVILKKECDDVNRCRTVIAQRLVGYLAPWTEGNGTMRFSSGYNTSKIEYFIECMDDMVEAVKELSVSCGGTEYRGDIIPDRADVIFTSVPAEEHVILTSEE